MGRLYTVAGATTDGEYLSDEMTLDYPDFRLIGIDFFDVAGNKVTPTGGEVSVLVDQGFGGYTNVQSGTFCAAAAGTESWPNPTFSGGVARCKIVLTGVTGAESFRASVYRGDIDEALPLRGSYKQTKRVAVDVAQTGFWEGREFRVQLDKTAAYTLKFVSPVDFILQFQNLQTHDGISAFSAYSADQISAEATPFNDVVQILPNNGMSNTPAYSGQVQIFGGGSITLNGAQIPREYIKVKAATATAQQTTVGGNAVKERGLPAGTYYLVFTGTDYSYRLIFEERP